MLPLYQLLEHMLEIISFDLIFRDQHITFVLSNLIKKRANLYFGATILHILRINDGIIVRFCKIYVNCSKSLSYQTKHENI